MVLYLNLFFYFTNVLYKYDPYGKHKKKNPKKPQGDYPEYGTYIDINALLKTSERIGLITSQQFISPNQINKSYLLGF